MPQALWWPGRHEALTQCCFIAGTASQTVGQHKNDICLKIFIGSYNRALTNNKTKSIYIIAITCQTFQSLLHFSYFANGINAVTGFKKNFSNAAMRGWMFLAYIIVIFKNNGHHAVGIINLTIQLNLSIIKCTFC